MESTKFELLVDNEMQVFTGEQIIEEVKSMMGSMYIKQDEQGGYFSEIYADYRDELGESMIKEITQSENPMEAFYEVLDEVVMDSIMYEEDNFMNEISRNWNEEKYGDFFEYQDFVRDWMHDNVYFNFPFDHYLNTDVQVNLVVDTGDGNYDYTLNSFLSYNGDGTIEPESSILWLIKQQGYTSKDLIEAIENGTENSFLKSVIEELQNVTSHMNALTFFVSMNLKDYIDFLENGKSIVLDIGTSCGLMDYWSGAGGVLNIQLESSVELSKDIVEPHIDGNRGYGVDDVYGMSYDFWTDTVDTVKK